MLRTKKSHLAVAFFLRPRITTWLARKLQQLEQMRLQQVRKLRVQEQQLVREQQQRGQLLELELLLSYRKRPRQRQR